MSNYRDCVNKMLAEYNPDAYADLHLDENGTCVLTTDDGLELVLHLFDDEDTLYLRISLVECVAESLGYYAGTALRLNAAQGDMKGSTIAFDAESSELVLCSNLKLENLGFHDFDRHLRESFKIAHRLREAMALITIGCEGQARGHLGTRDRSDAARHDDTWPLHSPTSEPTAFEPTTMTHIMNLV